jgi:mitogen-activated protein kinase 1/3
METDGDAARPTGGAGAAATAAAAAAGPHYVELREVGRGSFGTVWKAKDTRNNNQRVAIKVMRGGLDTAGSAKRLLRELTILRICRHPCIISAHDVLEPDSCPQLHLGRGDVAYSMELLQIDLASLLGTAEHRRDWSRHHVRFLLFQLVAGVAFLHSRGVLHRDLKPSNLLVNTHCDLKICDFGLALVRPPRPAEGDQCNQAATVRLEPPRTAAGAAAGAAAAAAGARGGGGGAGGRAASAAARGGGAAGSAGGTALVRNRSMTMHVVTRWYRAPEVILEWPDYGAAIDMWSVGCIVGELLQTLQPGAPACTPLFMGDRSAMSDGEDEEDEDCSEGDDEVCRINAEVCDVHSQLSAILAVIGCPGDGEIDAFPAGLRERCEALRALCTSLPPLRRRHSGFGDLFPAATTQLLELVGGLLAFNPARRLSAEQALRLDVFARARASFVRDRRFSLEEFEPPRLDLTGLVDGFETTTSVEALAGFVEQERGAWRGRRVGQRVRT